ncbi:AAA family ATPase, partial [Acinetobacter baumannii]|nr:AAA family ATPase [Acinetobacter baumannii]
MIKLGRLRLNNFKSFHEEFFDFRNLDVIIFDGPNGYGKTSIFDAIEFCVTRNISRIKEIDNKVKSTPLLRLDKEFVGVLNLEIIENNLTKIVLELVIPIIDIKSHKDNIAHEVFFYEKWEDIGKLEKRKNIESLQDFLNIENLDQLFTIFNYIQQEDALHFLKVDEVKRHKKIDFLFGIEKQKNELNKIEKFEKALNDKCSEVFKELVELKGKID